ncbi:MAG: sensor histidine kinase, partial [Acidiferrobacterales bacterium]
SKLGAQRIYLTYDITAQEQRERLLLLVLVVGVIGISIVAAGLGFRFSRTLIAPVAQLAKRVQGLDPGERQVELSSEFRGAEVEIIAKAFDRYMRRLDSFVEREQSFTATASHELRTPLTVIQGAAEILTAQQKLTKGGRNAVTRIRSASIEMAEFIQALLFLAREGAPPSDHNHDGCELTEIIPAIIDEHRHLLNGKSVSLSFTCENPLKVYGPPSVVTIVIGNLLRNAIAHTESGTILIHLQDRTVSIQDTGKGIPAKDLEGVFGRHFSTQSDGNGVGLYLVKSICDRYGWKIDLRSTLGKGTTVVLSFES